MQYAGQTPDINMQLLILLGVVIGVLFLAVLYYLFRLHVKTNELQRRQGEIDRILAAVAQELQRISPEAASHWSETISPTKDGVPSPKWIEVSGRAVQIFRILAWCGIVGFLLANLAILFHRAQPDIAFTLQNPSLSASQKLKLPQTYAQAYDLVELLVQTTPPTSTILIPDFNDLAMRAIWHDASNPHLMAGFLYPRKVVAASNTTWDTDWKSNTQSDVYILALTRERNGQVYEWPAKRSSIQDIVYANSGGWGYAPLPR